MIKRNLKYNFVLLSLLAYLSLGTLASCTSQESVNEQENTAMATENTTKIQRESFGTTPDGQQVTQFTLTNAKGMRVKVIDYGAIVTSVMVPDKNGNLGDVVLGFSSIDGYIPNDPHIGGMVGRYANRIAKGRFTLDGQEYRLAINNEPNHLHGGIIGFDRVMWTAEEMPEQNAVKLTYLSRDMEEGYPGNLTTTVIYTLTEDNGLKIDIMATTDKATPVNLTNHSYFNLSAGEVDHVLDHVVQINADRYIPVDGTFIPTGDLTRVSNTNMDLTQPQPIGKSINEVPGGYDHTYVLNGEKGQMKRAATVFEPTSGRVLEVYTTQPGIQFYTGNFLDGSLTGKNGDKYTRHYGFCLETQHFPDSPNQENFPSTILRPGDTFQETTVYRFSTREEI
ncbi:MAG: galactose mutarotase [Hymenobacteraceae bacterium]|nr:galactose mutarotase [Hymenobacteraceae bacterium]